MNNTHINDVDIPQEFHHRPLVLYSYYQPVSQKIPEVTKQEHDLGRSLLSLGLDQILVSDNNGYEVSISDTGKPYLTDHPQIEFNISHCDGLAACGFSSLPIGVDVEMPAYFAPILIDHALSPSEKDFVESAGEDMDLKQEYFFRIWTLKEAYVKQSGEGVDTDLKAVSFLISQAPLETDKASQWLSVPCSDPTVTCWQTRLSHGQILSVCCPTGTAQPLLVTG